MNFLQLNDSIKIANIQQEIVTTDKDIQTPCRQNIKAFKNYRQKIHFSASRMPEELKKEANCSNVTISMTM